MTPVTILHQALAVQSAIVTDPEHCSLDADLVTQLGCNLGDQLRVTLLTGPLVQTKALFTLVEIREGGLRLGQTGRERLGGATSVVGASVALAWPPVHPTMSDAAAALAAGGEFVERVADDGRSTSLLALAPHGGSIEVETDRQAERVQARLAMKGASSWRCKGWRPGGGARAWHVTATDLSDGSFPLLQTLRPRGFAHVVAFHGFSGEGVRIGGGASLMMQTEIKDAFAKVLGGIAVVLAPSGDPLGGANPRNIVNRLAFDGGGVQIEQSLAVRSRYAMVVADAVAAVFDTKM